MSGKLWVLATPIGNLQDVTTRAVEVLRGADLIYAEDTRHTRKLLAHLDVHKPLCSAHEHNEASRADQVVAEVGAGKQVVLVSDAGTPAVSDPGAEVVRAVAAAGLAVAPVPGPSALTAALSVSGFGEASTHVLFLGFLPTQGKERAAALERVARHRGVVVLYEAPHRIVELLEELAAGDPERGACLCRELTKLHEEIVHAPLAGLRAALEEVDVRGEITLVLGPSALEPDSPTDEAVDRALARCLAAGLSARDASTAVAATLELSRREVYRRCQRLPRDGGEQD